MGNYTYNMAMAKMCENAVRAFSKEPDLVRFWNNAKIGFARRAQSELRRYGVDNSVQSLGRQTV